MSSTPGTGNHVSPQAQPASGYPRGRDRRGRVHTAAQLCRSCKRPMRWVTMPSGKRNPLDAEPSPAGNVLVIEGPDLWAMGVVIHDHDLREELREDLGRNLYTSHFATCPNADEHRKRERKDLE